MKKSTVRIGDFVDIVDPRLFVRCGYPMYLPDVQKQLADDRNLQYEITKLIALVARVPTANAHTLGADTWQRARTRILFELAEVKAKQEGFGGDTRSIYLTEPDLALQGQRVRVVGRRLVKTGKRFGPSGGCDYFGEYDYEPGGLDDAQTHTILSFEPPRIKLRTSHMAEIPRDHVRRPELWGLRHKSGYYLCDNMINTVKRTDDWFWNTWGGWSKDSKELLGAIKDWKVVLMQKGD